MKRIIGQIVLFVLSFTLFACIYIGVFKISMTAFLILLAVLVFYSVCMGIGEKSMQDLNRSSRRCRSEYKLPPRLRLKQNKMGKVFRQLAHWFLSNRSPKKQKRIAFAIRFCFWWRQLESNQ